MKTNITKVFQVTEPIEKVWANLSNPAGIVNCVPGATLVSQTDERNLKGEVLTKFGPVKVKYNGDIVITELDEANHVMKLTGKGLDSKGKGSADMDMVGTIVQKEGACEVTFNMEITITGMLAQFGSRLINDVTDHLLNEFVANFKKKLAGEQVNNEINAAKMTVEITKKKISNFFGGGKKDDASSS